MQPHSLPSDIKQSRLLKALQKVGFIIDWKSGKGSHAKAIDPISGKFIIIQNHLYKIILQEVLKEAEKLGYDASEIMTRY